MTEQFVFCEEMMDARRSDSGPMAGDEGDDDDDVVEVELHGRGSGGTTATGFRYKYSVNDFIVLSLRAVLSQ